MKLFLLVVLTAIFYNSDFTFWVAIGISIVLVAVIPELIKTYFQTRKYKNLPNINEMPQLILQTNKTNDWEEKFCLDMEGKFNDEKFIDKISRKQCRKLLEIYLERVRKVPEKEIDVSELSIHLGGRKIQ
jgi:hypothetical protein